jgi:glycosyltransferase involved in cell wall biosynthesis
MRKIIIYTQAYNAEKTLHRTVGSVLNQTYDNFEYIIVDNGSTDATGEIIKEYAQKDRRITPLANKLNHVWEPGNSIVDIIPRYDDSYFFSWLDADDELDRCFFEKLLAFMEGNCLDIAVCGNDFIDANTNALRGVRKLNEDLILAAPDDYNKHFPQYHQFMRTAWAKLYAFSALRDFDYEKLNRVNYGWDTCFVMEAFCRAKRVGILAQSLHKYYVSPQSMSYKLDVKRIISDRILFDVACDFLNNKAGKISKENSDFLFLVYFYAIKDTLNIVLNSQISLSDKFINILDVFQSEHTGELIKWPGAQKEKNQLFLQIAQWVASQEEARDGDGLDKAADILAAMRICPKQLDGWEDSQALGFLSKIKDKMEKDGVGVNIDEPVVSIASKVPMLAGEAPGFLLFFSEIIISILQNDEEKALNQIEEAIDQEADIPDEYIEPFLKLGLNLSAKLEYTNDFIYFKKLQISLLIDLGKTEEARLELADWDEMLPDDQDFKAMRARLT